MDPLDDFKAILSSDYGDTGNTGDEVLQRHTALQCVIALLQQAEFSCIAFCKARPKTDYWIKFQVISDLILTSALEEFHHVPPTNCGLRRTVCSEP